MVSIVMLAVMIDRTAISMRLVAIAAMAVLVLAPESLLSASFQMSFAAVVALVAVYEAAAPALARMRQGGGILGSRIGLFIAATLLTTLVASLATAPFAVYHFNGIALYGLLANAIAVPVMAMWIMPFALVSLVMMSFGLESLGLGLVPMGWGIEIVLLLAEKVASLQGAVALIPPIPTIGISILALGGLVLCMTRGKLRVAGIPLVAGPEWPASLSSRRRMFSSIAMVVLLQSIWAGDRRDVAGQGQEIRARHVAAASGGKRGAALAGCRNWIWRTDWLRPIRLHSQVRREDGCAGCRSRDRGGRFRTGRSCHLADPAPALDVRQ
jgi:ComEC/Rec2-related protein